LRILEIVAAVNDQRKRAMARKVSAMFGGKLRGKTVAVLGLTFKPNTDDMREAPTLALISARIRSSGHEPSASFAAGRGVLQKCLRLR
jgi:UDPglucose 6-dehydrogenase